METISRCARGQPLGIGVDEWSATQGRSVLGLTSRLLVRSETGEISGMREFVLGLIELDSNVTGSRVRKAVLDSLEPLGIRRAQIRAVVGDGGSNLQRGYGPLEYAPRIDGVIIHPSHGIGAYI